jgi:Transglutaminase-like superfamily
MPLSRRQLLRTTVLAASSLALHPSTPAAMPPDATPRSPDNLGSTALIQTQHPRIVALAKEITDTANSDRKAAVLVHDWVRDQIAFGIPGGFYETSATDTLDQKVGYCNTKCTLFAALLRARGIPTRLRMMDLSAQVLQGLFNPGSLYVDHGISEVFLDGRWVKVDSYVVDQPLAAAARKKLTANRCKAGLGIHIDGKTDWDGQSDNFIQCLDNQTIPRYVLKDHGLMVDVADFYQKALAPRNRKTLMSGLMIRWGSSYINRSIQSIRSETA